MYNSSGGAHAAGFDLKDLQPQYGEKQQSLILQLYSKSGIRKESIVRTFKEM